MGPDPHEERGETLPPPAPPPPSDGGRPGSNGSTGRAAYDRVPPHSLDAEVSVLGAALLSKNAAAEVIELVQPDDFYRSGHRTIFEAVRDLFARGEPIDSVTVVDWLGRHGTLDEVGGAPAIHDLLSQVPTAANATHYARIVREKAVLRRLIEVGTQIASIGYEGQDDAVSAVDRAEGMVYEIGQSGAGREYSQLKDLLNESFERIEQLAENRSEVTGLATGFNDLDRLTAGLQPQNLVIVAARPAMGKCLAGASVVVDYKSGERVSIAELVADRSRHGAFHVAAVGSDLRLHGTQPIDYVDNGVRQTFALTTRSGRNIRATANHPLLTWAGWVPLEQIDVGGVIAVPRALDVFGSDRLADAEPALLGYLIGDGTVTLGWTGQHQPDFLRERLEELGLWGRDSHTKFVPQAIFTAPRDQVATFLSRLYACDGSAWVAEEHGYFGISYTSVSERLARDVQHLLLRFGVMANLRERQVKLGDARHGAFELEIRDADNCRRFIEEIGIFSKEEQCARVLDAAAARTTSHTNTDLLPIEVWDLILAEKGDRSWADVSAATGRTRNHNWHVGKRRPSRRLVAELADALDSQRLHEAATSDVLWDEVVSIEPYGEERVYDLEVPHFHNFIANDIVVHNSALSMGLAHYVTAELNKPALIFSLEMSKLEIVMRLLSSEARIDSSKIRTGRLEDNDWRKLGDALGKLSNAPLFIDDTPSITLMEIRSKARRLKQRHGLDLVIVDYLQLMSSHKRVDNRQQEVAEFSRGLKMLAKELDVPVVALSQLSRQPESRTDKRPLLSDLRESGCLTRRTRLFRADTGHAVTFGELLDGELRDVPVWSLDERGRLTAQRLTHAFPSGHKPVFRVTLASGTVVEATANHPFLTIDGWRPLGDLEEGSAVATARSLPEPAAPSFVDTDELILAAHLIGEGTIVARQPIHYTSADEENLQAVTKAAFHRFGIEARREADGRSGVTTQLYLPSPHHLTHGRRNPIAAWLDGLGLWDKRSWEKRLPAFVFGLDDEQLRFFLHHLWSTDGSITRTRDGVSGPRLRVYYSTSSPGLAQDVRLALLRLGFQARVSRVEDRRGHRPNFHVRITGTAQQRRFLREVGSHGERGRHARAWADELDGVVSNPNVGAFPKELWTRIRELRAERGMSERAFQAALGTAYCGTTLYRSGLSRERLARVAEVLDDDGLRDAASSDVFWDRIAKVEPLGVQEVFDATVPGTHNFVAEGLILHNSLEQDADIVSFIYRDEVYDPDSPDRGIAELIIAKHRNGATGTVKLAFLNHLTKFANLAHGTSGAGAGGVPTPPRPPAGATPV